MGLHLLGTSDGRCADTAWRPGDPNPNQFKILSVEHIGNYMLLEIRYPAARNYGGRKLALYRAQPWQILQAEKLDPHFDENEGPTVPIARFPPTETGRLIAREVARLHRESEE